MASMGGLAEKVVVLRQALGCEAGTPLPQVIAQAESMLGLPANGTLVERADACCVAFGVRDSASSPAPPVNMGQPLLTATQSHEAVNPVVTQTSFREAVLAEDTRVAEQQRREQEQYERERREKEERREYQDRQDRLDRQERLERQERQERADRNERMQMERMKMGAGGVGVAAPQVVIQQVHNPYNLETYMLAGHYNHCCACPPFNTVMCFDITPMGPDAFKRKGCWMGVPAWNPLMLTCFDEKYTRIGLSDSFEMKACGKAHVMTFSDENTYTHSEACQPKGEKEGKTNHLEKRNAANAATNPP